jgi:hypothetical protein
VVFFGSCVGYYVVTGIACVCTVGVIVALVVLVYSTNGFYPFCDRMYFCCYLIFDF